MFGGRENGVARTILPNGDYTLSNYKDGKLDGVVKHFKQDGKLVKE